MVTTSSRQNGASPSSVGHAVHVCAAALAAGPTVGRAMALLRLLGCQRSLHLGHEIARLDTKGGRDLDDLHKIQPSLAFLELGDERLRAAEDFGQLDLSEPLGAPSGDQ
jgi:hypothetical protein